MKSLESSQVTRTLTCGAVDKITRSLVDERRGVQIMSLGRLGIVCPMANEVSTATTFVDEVLSVCVSEKRFSSVTFFAILDRVSTDGTLSALKAHREIRPNLMIVWSPQNKCVVDAYMRGYEEALKDGSDWILEIDAGYSHQPSEIPRLLNKIDDGYDCIFGSRFCEGGSFEDGPLTRKLVSLGGTWLVNKLVGTQLLDMTSGFQLFSRGSLESILRKGIKSRGPFFQTEMKIFSQPLQYIEVPITYKQPSHLIGWAHINDALANLWRLFALRVMGRL
jgi:dolichol-phosphate mannosyltransferase